MRKPTKKLLRIVIGGVLTITGIISGSYALVQLPDGISWYIPYVVISILTLPAGIYLCFGPIKFPQFLVRFSKMSKEEKACVYDSYINVDYVDGEQTCQDDDARTH